MKKEYRAEIQLLDRAQRKIQADYRQLERGMEKQIKLLNRALARGFKNTSRELERIERRRAILEGRLS